MVGRTLPDSLVEISNNVRRLNERVVRAGTSDAAGRFAIAIELNPDLNSLEVRSNHLATGEVIREAWLVIYEPTEGEFTMQITEPSDCISAPKNSLRITGKTAPGATVIVNDRFSAAVDANGDWSASIALLETGTNPITAVATMDGNTAADSITVIYRPE